MAGVNRIQIIGHLGSDPETQTLSKGGKVCKFRVAVDRPRKSDNGKGEAAADWFNVEAWGRLGEVCQEYLSKGRLVYLEGRLQTDRYEQDGEVKYFTKAVVSNMQILDRRNSEASVEAAEAASPG
ncbi:MAG: single-stranded DNA-binding protein [Anaerolineales bacterium]|nr:single-stranded DNA-binding protein [Anaerolineales bacterium]